ncbi:MAG: polynucleotide adenylyltransferase PcnB, partial [Burkholderiales bacterium]
RVADRWQARREAGEHTIPALMQAMDTVLDEQAEKLAIQRRFIADMREIWGLQPRFERTGRSAVRVLEHLRFRAGYDFMLLRVQAGELSAEIGQWWQAFVESDPTAREALLARAPAESRSGAPRRRRRRSSGRKARPGEAGSDAAQGAAAAGPGHAPD